MTRRASIWRLQVVFIAGTFFFLVMACWSAYLSTISGLSWLVPAAFAIFCIFEIMLALTRGPVEINETGIGTSTAIGRYGMRWDDVTAIVIGASDLWIIGADKHLALVAPSFWSGPDKLEARRILEEKAQHVKKKKPFLILPWSSNCSMN